MSIFLATNKPENRENIKCSIISKVNDSWLKRNSSSSSFELKNSFSKVHKRKSQKEAKMIMMSLSFSLPEFLNLYYEFVNEFTLNGNYKFKLEEFAAIIHKFTSKEYIGKANMIKIIELCNEDFHNKLINNKRSHKSNKFDPEVYIGLFDKLTINSSDYLPFKKLSPLFMVFFLSK